MSNSIAIVGTRGAGKTVLVTVLANYLSTPKNGVMLIPDSYEIGEYVDLNYAKLQRGDWLDSTNVERKLSWKLRTPGKEDQKLTVLDCPGEDIQRLFARREFEGEKSSKSNRDKELVEYLLGASTVLVLINLQDFIDESYEEDNVRNRKLREHSLKEFLTAIKENQPQNMLEQSLRQPTDFRLIGDSTLDEDRDADRPSRQIALVFTAYNQYHEHIKKRYGHVAVFLSEKLPALYYEHLDGNGVTGILVSAVADTVEDGFPKPGFKHKGLDTLIEWLVDPFQYEKVRGQRQHEPQEQQQQEQNDAGGPRMYEW
jgi:hypothetical protein